MHHLFQPAHSLNLKIVEKVQLLKLTFFTIDELWEKQKLCFKYNFRARNFKFTSIRKISTERGKQRFIPTPINFSLSFTIKFIFIPEIKIF